MTIDDYGFVKLDLLAPTRVKLWHDDIRFPPDRSWWWARTNEDAQKILLDDRWTVTECSLDHDLGLHEADPSAPDADMQMGWDAENDGYKLVKWMVEHDCVPARVTIHSWNSVGAGNMATYLANASRHGIIRPIELIVRKFIRQICPHHGTPLTPLAGDLFCVECDRGGF